MSKVIYRVLGKENNFKRIIEKSIHFDKVDMKLDVYLYSMVLDKKCQ